LMTQKVLWGNYICIKIRCWTIKVARGAREHITRRKHDETTEKRLKKHFHNDYLSD